MVDFNDFGLPQYDPNYIMPEGHEPMYTIDEATFCTHIRQHCEKKGLLPANSNPKDFVERCREKLPEIGFTDVQLGEGRYLWNYRSSTGNWAGFYPKSQNVFSIYRPTDVAKGTGGEEVLRQVANNMATPDRCNDFGSGTPTRQTRPARHHDTDPNVLLMQRQEPSLWDTVKDLAETAAWGAAAAGSAVLVAALIGDDAFGFGAVDDAAIAPVSGFCAYALDRFQAILAH